MLSVGAYENTKGGLLNQNNLIILGILELSGLLRRKILTAQAINEEEQFEEIVVCEYHGARQWCAEETGSQGGKCSQVS